MSRELLKRAATLIKCLNGASWEHEVPQVVIQDIEAYLVQPEPEPVLLNEDEINEMVCDYSQTNIWEFVRSIEQAVLKANGFKVGE